MIIAAKSNKNKQVYFAGIVANEAQEEDIAGKVLSRLLVRCLDMNVLSSLNLDFTQNCTNGDTNQVKTITQLHPDHKSGDKIIIDKIMNQIDLLSDMEEYTKLLESNFNLILTGAPGTGKTYLAKQIALQLLFGKQSYEDLTEEEKQIFKVRFAFIQFHPSYDYTDFVEGLRPVKDEENDSIGFERKDGVFKTFCKEAQKILNNAFDIIYKQLKNEGEIWIDKEEVKFGMAADDNSSRIKIQLDRNHSISNSTLYIQNTLKLEVLKNNLQEAYKNFNVYKSRRFPFVFVIDEINRGEISKIFGELFFSIDSGYRGERGKVQTQYSNLVESDDIFKSGFFVPENVYVIGTMNDIDRSVECMDFAMRRRFAWKEIKAIDRVLMWNSNIDRWKKEASERMNSLNSAIEKIEGLTSAYHIGPAYFLKLSDYNGDFEKLWSNHLKGTLFEYLRGMPRIEEKLEVLKKAYDNGVGEITINNK